MRTATLPQHCYASWPTYLSDRSKPSALLHQPILRVLPPYRLALVQNLAAEGLVQFAVGSLPQPILDAAILDHFFGVCGVLDCEDVAGTCGDDMIHETRKIVRRSMNQATGGKDEFVAVGDIHPVPNWMLARLHASDDCLATREIIDIIPLHHDTMIGCLQYRAQIESRPAPNLVHAPRASELHDVVPEGDAGAPVNAVAFRIFVAETAAPELFLLVHANRSAYIFSAISKSSSLLMSI